MEYENIPIYLKRYSFPSKMKICYKHSCKTMDLWKPVDAKVMRTIWLPWEIETFALFAIVNREYNDNDISGKDERKYYEVMNSIRAHSPTKRIRKEGYTDPVSSVMMLCGLTQFDIQEYRLYKYYRYQCLFNYIDRDLNINTANAFFAKFGASYSDFWELSTIMDFCISIRHIGDISEVVCYILKKYSHVVNSLVVTRDEYTKQMKGFAKSIDDYQYCIRPSYSFPFVQDQNTIYLPLPHLLYRATTSSLLYRLTENNSALRTQFGKPVLEQYLLSVLEDSNCYDEVCSEMEYISNGTP